MVDGGIVSLELLVKMTSKCIKHQPDGLLQSAIFHINLWEKYHPYGYYKALGCKKISSDEDIGVALKKAKKGFFGLGRTWKVQQQNLHYIEDLVLRGLQEASKTVQVQDLIHRSEAAREMGINGGTHH